MAASDQNRFVELEKLISALHDGVAGTQDLTRLENLLSGDPEACEFYMDYTEMVAAMDLELATAQPIGIGSKTVPLSIAQTTSQFYEGQRTSELHDSPSTREILNPSWRPLPWFAAAAALMVFAGSLALFFGKKGPIGATEVQAAETVAIDDGVAVLSESVGARFGTAGLNPRSGAILPIGEIVLESGIVEIEFYSGARVIVEGPAEFELASENSGILREGRLRAHVPPQAIGFSITTPQLDTLLKIANRDTEFGISIEEDGHLTEAHCFTGEIHVYDASTNRDPRSLSQLAAQEGLRVDRSGKRKIEADGMSFISYADMAQTSLENAALRHERWQLLIEKMRADEHILALFSFEEQGPRERTLVNQAAYREQASHGAIVGCRWTNGRWPSKGALEFSRASDRVRVQAAEDTSHPTVTFAAWVRLDALPRRGSTLMASTDPLPGTAEWSLNRDGKLLLTVRGGNGSRLHRYHSTPVFNRSEIGKWHHIATVYDSAAGRVTHFLDGHQVSEQGINPGARVPVSLHKAEIGNFGGRVANGQRPVRHFSGRIDEFAIYGRALDGNQIAEMVQVGLPY